MVVVVVCVFGLCGVRVLCEVCVGVCVCGGGDPEHWPKTLDTFFIAVFGKEFFSK